LGHPKKSCKTGCLVGRPQKFINFYRGLKLMAELVQI